MCPPDLTGEADAIATRLYARSSALLCSPGIEPRVSLVAHVLVIDGTDSMRLVMEDVKARVTALVRAIHRLVPTARMGIVVYGGEGEPLDVQPLTLSSAKLERFLTGIQAKGGGSEWAENLAGAIQTAVEQMD